MVSAAESERASHMGATAGAQNEDQTQKRKSVCVLSEENLSTARLAFQPLDKRQRGRGRGRHVAVEQSLNIRFL